MNRKRFCVSAFFISLFIISLGAENTKGLEMDEFTFGNSRLKIYFLGHASVLLDVDGKIIYVDPVSRYADFAQLPKADLILISHEHGDHLDPEAINAITKNTTQLVSNESSLKKLVNAKVLKNYQSISFGNIQIQAFPAYNTTPGREQFHPKGRDNGYILSFGKTKIYLAGDTEDIPEMKDLEGIDLAFLPVNQPYTMTPDQLLAAARMFEPKILYPYHFGNTDKSLMEDLLKKNTSIDVRMRNME